MMPVQAIFADYLAGYVGAAAVASALLRRADEGGSYQVRVSLTRMAMWAQEIGLLDEAALSGSKAWADLVRETDLPTATVASPFGEITYLPSLIEMTDVRPGFVRGPQPLGSSPLAWEQN